MERRIALLHLFGVEFFLYPFLGHFSSNSMSINFLWTLAVTASRQLHVVLVNRHVLWPSCQE